MVIYYIGYVYLRPYVYSFCRIFQALCLFPALRLLRTQEQRKISTLHDCKRKTQNPKNIKSCPLLLGLTDGPCIIKGLIEMRGGYHSGVIHKLRSQDEIGRWSKNVHTIKNVNAGGQVVKKSQNLVNIVCERPLRENEQKWPQIIRYKQVVCS